MKKYWTEFKNSYKILRILKYSLVSLIVLLVVDNYNLLTKVSGSSFQRLIIILILIYLSVEVIDNKLISVLKLKIINYIDMLLVCLVIIGVSFSAINYRLYPMQIYKTVTPLAIVCLCFITLIYRIIVISKGYKDINRDTNVHDLKELYEGTITTDNGIILINEDEVEYDLLSRDSIIDNLYDTLINCNPAKKFVISLEGAWGIGKTTILNIVVARIKENHEDVIIIRDFDPWTYNDECSMFRAMFDIILRESKMKYSIAKANKLIDDLYGLLFENKQMKGFKNFNIFKRNDDLNISNIKRMVNNYLEVNNKKIIFIIDNLDRASNDNINLIFKLVNNVFDFKYVTYVLAYDEDRIKKVLEENLTMDYDYLKKVIQLQIKVPEIQTNVKKDVVNKCVSNLLALYGVNKDELKQYDTFIGSLSDIIGDIRDFKRFLNSVMSFAYRSHKHLNPVDIVGIEVIKIYNYKLYKSILENRQFFISHDKEYCAMSFEYALDSKKLNAEAKVYFDNLFEDNENKKNISLLEMLFPYISKYGKKRILEFETPIIYDRSEELKELTRNNRICSAKFFDLYFNNSTNEFIHINKVLGEWIISINQGKEIDELVIGIIKDTDKELHKVLMETIQYYIDDIKEDKLGQIAISFFNKLDYIDDSSVFLGVNAKDRATYIISKLLLKVSSNEFNNFLNNIRKSYKRLSVIDTIIYDLENDSSELKVLAKDRSTKLKDILKNMNNEIYEKSIDIYENVNYSSKNIWGLYNNFKENSLEIKDYVGRILNSDNIIKFLYDVVRMSHGQTFNYYITKDYIERFTSIEVVDKLISERKENTEDEEFVLSVYRVFKEEKTDYSGKCNVVCESERKVKLN